MVFQSVFLNCTISHDFLIKTIESEVIDPMICEFHLCIELMEMNFNPVLTNWSYINFLLINNKSRSSALSRVYWY